MTIAYFDGDDFFDFDFDGDGSEFDQDAESGDIEKTSISPGRATTPISVWGFRGLLTPATPRT